MALITIDDFRALPLGLKDSILGKIGDAALQNFIDTASVQVANYCDRQLESAEVVEEIEGNGMLILLLREYPMTELKSITWIDDLGMEGEEDILLFRWTKSGVLKWKSPVTWGAPFQRGRLYTVTYIAGYSPIPGPIKHATGLWVTELLQPVFNQGAAGKPTELVALSSEQIGELLEEYRRKGAR
jgi:hypothetical protein